MSDTQLIKDKLDIVDFVAEYVQLKPAGLNHKGLCPFHHEKSPSFMVNRERQNWHCFGSCSDGGDIFSFVQKIEGMDFIEALKFLANRAGVQLQESLANKAETSQRARIKEINTVTARFYHHILLNTPVAKEAREYLDRRGLKPETIDEWNIGFIPDQWDLLTKYLLKKGFSVDDLVASGLAIKKDSADASGQRGYYDRFRGRVMFPICDVYGSAIGFTGRVLVETEHSGGKYVNTPQTVLYDKSQVIFGLNKAKKSIKEKNLAVLVEGQMDVIACHSAGMENVVATSGTALTERQIDLLKRYTANFAMAFDADSAGQNAARRGIDLAREAGISLKIIKIPDGAGKDPDECIRKNPEIWRESVDRAQDVMEWIIGKSLTGKNMSDPRQRQDAVNEILREIARIPFAVERDGWLKIVSSRIGEEVSVLRENMEEIKKTATKQLRRIGEVEGGNEARMAPIQASRINSLAERLFALITKFPKAASVIDWSEDGMAQSVSSTHFLPLYLFLKNEYTPPNNASAVWQLDKLREACEITDSENLVDVLILKGDLDFFDVSENEAINEARILQDAVKGEWKKQRITELTRALRIAENENDQEKLNSLLAEFNRLH